MEPTQIDRVIGAYLGWTEIEFHGSSCRLFGITPNSKGKKYRIEAVPQFHKCLNACHEMEKALDAASEWNGEEHHACAEEAYMGHLADITSRRDDWMLIHATAIQRCEAFLRTIGKYQEPEKLSTHVAV